MTVIPETHCVYEIRYMRFYLFDTVSCFFHYSMLKSFMTLKSGWSNDFMNKKCVLHVYIHLITINRYQYINKKSLITLGNHFFPILVFRYTYYIC